MSLVLELQQLAWDNQNDISDLIKKAYAVSFKLNLRSFKTWTECELNGYIGKKMPPYRQIRGRVVCLNPFRGWIPFLCADDPKLQANLSCRWLNTPVGVLQEFLQRNNNENSIIDFEPELEHALMQRMDVPFRPALEVPRSAYISILDKVRNTILNWSLRLEADGILGEGLTFSPQEKKAAAAKEKDLRPLVAINVNNNNVTVDRMDKSAIQQSSPASEMYFDPDEYEG